MAYTVTFGNNGRPAKYREFEIDTPDDLADIGINDADVGSVAHSRSDNTTYKLGNNREWYALTEGGGGGGGGGDNPVFALYLNENDADMQFESPSTWGDLHNAILAKKIITAVVINATDDENVQLIYPIISGVAAYIDNDKWNIEGTFTFIGRVYNIIGNEDDANVTITIPMPIG